MYQIAYHINIQDDFMKIGKSAAVMIRRAIDKKLKVDPEGYGEALTRDLRGLWKLKVSKYRVVYAIYEDIVTVFIVAIDHRRSEEVYKQAKKRK